MSFRLLIAPLAVAVSAAACSSAPTNAPAPITPSADGGAPNAITTPNAATCPGADAALEQAGKSLETAVTRAGGTGGIVSILCNGIVTSKPVGVVKKGGDPVKETTRFQFASITKTFTAVTALSLVSEGKVKLDVPVTTYVPFVKDTYPGARPITLHDLLTHTAGYAVDIPNASYEDDSLEGWFKVNGQEPPWSPPGAVFDYSNLGFSLAGLALQRATSTPFPTLVEARVFAKAGMTRATMSTERVQAEGDFAYGHSEGQALAPLDAYFQSGQYGPMGGAWGSAADLAAFAKALATKDAAVLDAAAWQRMVDVRGKTTWPGQQYGYGLIIDEANPELRGHDGSAQGFTSSMKVIANAGVGVFVVANGNGVDSEELSSRVLETLAHAGPPPAPTTVGSSDDWVGTYQDPIHLGTVSVTKTSTGYAATWNGKSRGLEMIYDDTAAYADPTYGELTASFWRGASGKVEWLVTTEGHARKTN